MRWALTALLLIVFAFALGQEGGGGENPGGTDSNPGNPLNWQITYANLSGEDTLTKIEIVNNVEEWATYTRDWTTML